MKFIKIVTVISVSLLSAQIFAAPIPDLEANSLIKCVEGSSISSAVDELNETLASPFWNTRATTGNYLKIKDYVSSAPVITSLANGNYSVCVTVTRKK